MERILAYTSSSRRQIQASLKKAHLSFRVASDSKAFDREMVQYRPTRVIADIANVTISTTDVTAAIKRLQLEGDDMFVIFVDSSRPVAVTRMVESLRLDGQEALVSTGHIGAVEDLHNSKNGRLDAGLIADWMGVSLTRFSKFLGRSPQTVHKTPSAQRLQKGLSVFSRVVSSLKSLFDTQERGRIWLNAPNPNLDGVTPISLFERRKVEVVAELLEDALLGHPG